MEATTSLEAIPVSNSASWVQHVGEGSSCFGQASSPESPVVDTWSSKASKYDCCYLKHLSLLLDLQIQPFTLNPIAETAALGVQTLGTTSPSTPAAGANHSAGSQISSQTLGREGLHFGGFGLGVQDNGKEAGNY